MNHKQLLKLFKDKTGGRTTIEIKSAEPAAPFQASRIQEYQMVGRRG